LEVKPSSRYARTATAEFETSDGRKIVYFKRRFLPYGRTLPHLVDITVTEGDRLDNLTAAALGDPEQFWRICDANDAMNPFDLVAEPDTVLKVPVPQVEEPR